MGDLFAKSLIANLNFWPFPAFPNELEGLKVKFLGQTLQRAANIFSCHPIESITWDSVRKYKMVHRGLPSSISAILENCAV